MSSVSRADKSTLFESFLHPPLLRTHPSSSTQEYINIRLHLESFTELSLINVAYWSRAMFGVLRPGSPEPQQRMPISPTASPPLARTLAPMPPGEFHNREELMASCKDWAAHQGFAVVIARSRFNRLWIKCDRGGTYENRRNLMPDQRKRKRGDSRLLGCPFRMIASCKKDGVWKVETTNADHNHDPSNDLSAHPTLRRMTEEQTQKVGEMFDTGRSPAETMEELKILWPDIKVLTRDIYNARKKYKTEKELIEGPSGERPYEDPNGLFPGPSPNGRWAWVPDGEEVTSRRTKKRRRTAPAQSAQAPATPSILDPQLQTQDISHTSQQSVAAIGQRLLDGIHDQAQASFLQNSQSQFGGYGSSPTSVQQQHHHIPTSGDVNEINSNLYPTTDDSSSALPPYSNPQINTTSPSSLRAQRQSAPTATMSGAGPPSSDTTSISAAAQGVAKAQSGLVIMSRIERMEKEQRDQKNMLAQILGAVQGIHGNPG